MLEALEAYKDIPHSPEYATALFVELHKTAGGYTIEARNSQFVCSLGIGLQLSSNLLLRSITRT